MAHFSLDELATLSEEQAVRSRFDIHNFRRARWFLLAFAGVALIEVIASLGEGPLRPLVAALNFLLAMSLGLAVGRLSAGARPGEGRLAILEPVARLLEGQSRGLATGFLIVQYLLLVLYGLGGGEPAPWLIAFPYLALFFRISPPERLLVHAVLLGAPTFLALAGVPLDAEPGSATPLLIAVAVNGAIPLGIGLLATRRTRRLVVRDWREAHERHKEQLRMRQELDAARDIQLAMLPLDCPALPWLDVCTLSLPAMEVGGDYYDFFELPEDGREAAGGLMVVSGDVAGHGVASGIVLAGLRSGLTLLTEELADPLAVMGKLHRMVQKTSRRRMLVTLALLHLDRERSTATVTSAGHPPVLHRRAADGGVEELAAASLPLGTQLPPAFGQRVESFALGDVFLLYSDGVYELLGREGEAYGVERLQAALAAAAGAPAAAPADSAGAAARGEATATEIRDALLEDLWEFKGEVRQADDITLVVLRVRG
jgi:serine phosphatase RsbU (regulator of sigma subunit)